MMKYLFINEVVGTTSTGKIVADQCRKVMAQGNEAIVAYGRWAENCSDVNTYRIGNDIDVRIHGIMTRLFDRHGLCSTGATEKFVSWADEYKPDIVYLHNLHGYYINYEVLFSWIKTHPERKYYWMLHDCWSFTGHCSHFMYVKCNKWNTQCLRCPQLRQYPACWLFPNTKDNYNRKKAAFTGVQNLTLVMPSYWLESVVKQSFLKEYAVEVHHNKINTDVFKPTPSDFREQHGLKDKIIILGVANVWNDRKGLKDFILLRKMLDDRYAIVMVGLTKKQIKKINRIMENDSREQTATIHYTVDSQKANVQNVTKSVVIESNVEALYKTVTGESYIKNISPTMSKIVCIPKTDKASDLAAIYTAADLFVNTTYEDSYPTVNLEARACGTPVITYDSGGCRETVEDNI